eukprot:1150624-Pelagomonas_calceolata.AAC.3
MKVHCAHPFADELQEPSKNAAARLNLKSVGKWELQEPSKSAIARAITDQDQLVSADALAFQSLWEILDIWILLGQKFHGLLAELESPTHA